MTYAFIYDEKVKVGNRTMACCRACNHGYFIDTGCRYCKGLIDLSNEPDEVPVQISSDDARRGRIKKVPPPLPEPEYIPKPKLSLEEMLQYVKRVPQIQDVEQAKIICSLYGYSPRYVKKYVTYNADVIKRVYNIFDYEISKKAI